MNPFAPLANVLLLFTVLVTLGHIGLCAIWPYKTCRRCDGTGQIPGPFGGIRLCRQCDATGLRLLIARRIWNSARRLYRDINDFRDR